MREAIRVLVAEGLASLLPRRGAVVATATADELRGLFLTVGGIESVCAPLACQNLSSAEIREIEQHHATMLANQAAGNRSEYFRANQAIHQAVVRGSKNKFMFELHAALSLRILRSRFFSELPGSAWARSTKEHKAMIRLIRKRDGAALGALMLNHMVSSWSDVEAQYSVQVRTRPETPRGSR
jgi:DNA-binding GntR family transcriptional regulator